MTGVVFQHRLVFIRSVAFCRQSVRKLLKQLNPQTR